MMWVCVHGGVYVYMQLEIPVNVAHLCARMCGAHVQARAGVCRRVHARWCVRACYLRHQVLLLPLALGILLLPAPRALLQRALDLCQAARAARALPLPLLQRGLGGRQRVLQAGQGGGGGGRLLHLQARLLLQPRLVPLQVQQPVFGRRQPARHHPGRGPCLGQLHTARLDHCQPLP